MKAQKKCEAGKYTATEGQSTCLLTEPGKEAKADKTGQLDCAKGETSTPGGVCGPCDPGSFAGDEGSPSCTPARKGYYVKDSDRTEEIKCDEGSYSPGSGATACARCPLGTYTKDKARSVCEKAKKGWYVVCAEIKFDDAFMAWQCASLTARLSQHR